MHPPPPGQLQRPRRPRPRPPDPAHRVRRRTDLGRHRPHLPRTPPGQNTLEDETGNRGRWLFQLEAGAAEITPTHLEGQVSLTQRQLAVWYAGGYRSTASARMAGVHAVTDAALSSLLQTTAELEPWLPDHF
ncbi:sterol carrier protein domain-containing protein [Streptomyces sp. NPDC051555]|uniref:sterol carrier protein domain-containing protein n=1 Tax=Streptomyces sp. NPDC051555 TaxID=3365657 RepID=UPI0037A46005